MLNNLRESAHGIFGRILLAILVLSFGIWGIGDMFRSGGGSTTIAKVGKSAISVQEFSRALHMREEEIARRMGPAYNPEMLKKLRLDLMVRDELINNHLIQNETEALGIVTSDEDVVKAIGDEPAFKDKDGKFDKEAYLAALRNRGIAEQRYVQDVRQTLASQLLIDLVESSVIVPEDMALAIYRANGEQRSANLMVLTPSAIKNFPVPTETEIKKYYEDNSKQFQTPEYRDASYVELKLADVLPKVEVSEDEIKQAYNDRIQDMQLPERRELEQLLFDREEDADKAYDKLQHGKFDEVAKTTKATNKDKPTVGLMSRQDLPADEGTKVFALKEGEISKPFKSDFGWHIFHVTKIIPPSVKPLASVHAEIAKELSATKATDTLTRLVNQMEDDMAGGASLEDAAKKAGLKVMTAKQFSREGLSPDGQKAALPMYPNFAETAFSYNEKEHSQAVQGADGSYFIVRVDHIAPEHIRPLSEVHERIAGILKEEKSADTVKKVANETANTLRKGKMPDVSLVPYSSGSITRDAISTADKKLQLPRPLVTELFDIKPHEYSHAYRMNNGDYIIASLDKILPVTGAPDAKSLETLTNDVKKALVHEAMTDYLNYLHGKYSISINQAAFTIKDDSGQE